MASPILDQSPISRGEAGLPRGGLYRRLRRAVADAALPAGASGPAVSGSDIAGLPPVVQRYLRFMGAGGARMWMEEQIGTRINETRSAEALGTGAELVTAACPYCIVMLTDGVAARKQQDGAAEDVRVADVSEVLLRSVRGTGDGTGSG